MSGNEFDFNIDSILEEFSLYSQGIGGEEKPAHPSAVEEAPLPPRREAYSRESIPAEENSYTPPNNPDLQYTKESEHSACVFSDSLPC